MSDEEFVCCLAGNLAMRQSLRPLLAAGAKTPWRVLAREIMALPAIVAERNEVDRIMRDMDVLRHLKISALNEYERQATLIAHHEAKGGEA